MRKAETDRVTLVNARVEEALEGYGSDLMRLGQVKAYRALVRRWGSLAPTVKVAYCTRQALAGAICELESHFEHF